MNIPIFFCERTGVRHYEQSFRCAPCDAHWSEPITQADYDGKWPDPKPLRPCPKCGAAREMSSRGSKTEFRRTDTGEVFTKIPPAAVYDYKACDEEAYNWAQSPRADGKKYRVTRQNEQDGRVLACVCPDGHHWIIDSRASNCTMPGDDSHWCWVRHGSPEDLTLHVDKNGVTCAAGAESIATGSWHGFLHCGQLVQC